MNWLWVNGWGVEPEALKGWAEQLFPSLNHSVVLPARMDRIENDFNQIIGWSWGGFRILEQLIKSPNLNELPPITLIAPFLGFCKEDQLGGKCSRVQVNFLKRWMARNPLSALADFYQRAGVSFEIPSSESNHFGFWISELEAMAKDKLDLQKISSAFGKTSVRILVGEDDTLVDTSWLVQNLGAISIKGVGHNISNFSDFLLCNL